MNNIKSKTGLLISLLAAGGVAIGFVRASSTGAQWWVYFLLAIAAIVPFVVAIASLGFNETHAKGILMAIGIGMVMGGIGLAAAGTWSATGVLIGNGLMLMIMASTNKIRAIAFIHFMGRYF